MWMDFLIIVKPQTVIDWQNRRFKKHWAKISSQNKQLGVKPKVTPYEAPWQNGIAERLSMKEKWPFLGLDMIMRSHIYSLRLNKKNNKIREN